MTASPYDLARSVYESEPCARTLEADLVAHLLAGYVVSTPSVFAMFRPVRRDSGAEAILDPLIRHGNPDCWHVYLAAGNVAEILGFAPYELPWVSWERRNRLRFRRFRLVASKWTTARISRPTS